MRILTDNSFSRNFRENINKNIIVFLKIFYNFLRENVCQNMGKTGANAGGRIKNYFREHFVKTQR
jgi:hypothetical protein